MICYWQFLLSFPSFNEIIAPYPIKKKKKKKFTWDSRQTKQEVAKKTTTHFWHDGYSINTSSCGMRGQMLGFNFPERNFINIYTYIILE